jgi:hypothetical protein
MTGIEIGADVPPPGEGEVAVILTAPVIHAGTL